jgi:hypothetical protein
MMVRSRHEADGTRADQATRAEKAAAYFLIVIGLMVAALWLASLPGAFEEGLFDILGTGIYALTGQVAAQVGGVVWMPFVVAFLVAVITAFSYLELVTIPTGRRSRSLYE